MQRFSRSSILHLAVFGFYLLVVLVVTYPLITQFSTALVGFVYGDGYEMAHHIWWFKHALQTGQPPFYQTMLAYPDGIEGVTCGLIRCNSSRRGCSHLRCRCPLPRTWRLLLTLALNGWAMLVGSGAAKQSCERPGSATQAAGNGGRASSGAGEKPRGDGRESRRQPACATVALQRDAARWSRGWCSCCTDDAGTPGGGTRRTAGAVAGAAVRVRRCCGCATHLRWTLLRASSALCALAAKCKLPHR